MSNPPSSQPVWHALDPEATLNALDSRDEGLDAAEAGRRQQRHGPNLLPQAAGRPAWQRFLLQFHNLLIYVLLAAALLTGLGLFDKVAKRAGAGTLVPITGFANAVVSAAIEFKPEGRVCGTGAKMFTIAGPVIVYGTLAAVVYGGVLWLLGG